MSVVGGAPILKVKAECEHSLAGPRTFKCPDCLGTMRRCCNSAIGTAHRGDCGAWAAKHLERFAAIAGVEESGG